MGEPMLSDYRKECAALHTEKMQLLTLTAAQQNEIFALRGALEAIVDDAGGGELDGDYAGCVAVNDTLIARAIDLLGDRLSELFPKGREVVDQYDQNDIRVFAKGVVAGVVTAEPNVRQLARHYVHLRLRDPMQALVAAQQQLVYWWNETGRCPCGARKATPITHSHVIGCPTESGVREAAALSGEAQ